MSNRSRWKLSGRLIALRDHHYRELDAATKRLAKATTRDCRNANAFAENDARTAIETINLAMQELGMLAREAGQ